VAEGWHVFGDFNRDLIETPEATICVRRAGNGPPLLLLHGYPQSHLMWHRIAPALAEEFTVVCPDLRGYGDSGKPPTTPDHEPYSKRAMAHDQVAVMQALGFEKFMVVGHDRGGRVAYRMALDHPDRVEKLATIDILPTGEMYRRTDMAFALGYWHWFFVTQPYDFPERVISAAPDAFLSWIDQPFFDPAAREQYRRCFSEPHMIPRLHRPHQGRHPVGSNRLAAERARCSGDDHARHDAAGSYVAEAYPSPVRTDLDSREGVARCCCWRMERRTRSARVMSCARLRAKFTASRTPAASHLCIWR
jgi:pimeloyl-ACP methyl ester carboxylesterase